MQLKNISFVAGHDDDLRRRLHDDSGSESSCSESPGSTAFRPRSSPTKDIPGPSNHAGEYPSPNISVGPPIHPPPHLLPYLYPTGLYPGAGAPSPFGPPLSLFTGSHGPAAAMNPSLLFNAQLALAAQHPALFSHYSNMAAHPPHGHHLSPTSPLHNHLKGGHRFTPYTLPNNVGSSPLGSAFETVTPGSQTRSLSNSPAGGKAPRGSSISPPPARSRTASPKPETASSPSDLKSIEKMVNGLDVKQATAEEVDK